MCREADIGNMNTQQAGGNLLWIDYVNAVNAATNSRKVKFSLGYIMRYFAPHCGENLFDTPQEYVTCEYCSKELENGKMLVYASMKGKLDLSVRQKQEIDGEK